MLSRMVSGKYRLMSIHHERPVPDDLLPDGAAAQDERLQGGRAAVLLGVAEYGDDVAAAHHRQLALDDGPPVGANGATAGQDVDERVEVRPPR